MTEPSTERRLAHERLATGGLARWTRACATHPWRVVFGWIGIIVVLIVLVATIGGRLKDEFEIPGSDTQKATDLIEAEFASEQGGVLNVVFAAPAGQRLDTPERKAAIEEAIAKLEDAGVQADRGQGGHRERRRSVQRPDTFSDDGRIAYAEAQFDRVDLRQGPRRGRRRRGRRPRGGRAGRRDGRVQRRRRVPADRAGASGAARPARGDSSCC